MVDRDAGNIDAEWPFLQQLIGELIASHAGRHPGIIAEAIVEQIAATYIMAPRETHHREQRKNHLERTRRFSHEVYRILADTPDIEPAREIAVRLFKSFLLTRLFIDEGRRLSHSIKGMALYEEQPGIAALSWAMGRGFDKLSGGGTGSALVAALEAAVPVLARMTEEVEEHGAPQADSGGSVAALEAHL